MQIQLSKDFKHIKRRFGKFHIILTLQVWRAHYLLLRPVLIAQLNFTL